MITISNLSEMLRHFYKGEQGEKKIGEAITKLLSFGEIQGNFYLIPKYIISNPITSTQFEIDLLLFHPVLGIYIIEVKSWENFNHLSEKNNPYTQVNRNKDVMLSLIRDYFNGELPINVESRVLYSRLTREKGLEALKEQTYFAENCNNISFFSDDLDSIEGFRNFFHTSTPRTAKTRELEYLFKLLIPSHINKNKSGITPIISPNELLFMDQKQLSIMNSYTSGFRILRGVAGTGKTAILSNFVNNRLLKAPQSKFLIICFNNNLSDSIKNCFPKETQIENICIFSLYHLIKHIKFDYPKDIPFEQRYEYFETDKALIEFRKRIKVYFKNRIDYVLFDETQDLPAGFLRIIYEETPNNNCIFFIDEAQRFFNFSMKSISEVFHHPKFEKIYMKGKVNNLKNVYRAPSNIAKCAFEILKQDSSLNQYYKQSHYLVDSFEQDINCVLKGGEIKIDDFDSEKNFKELIQQLPENESAFILCPFTLQKTNLEKWINECKTTKNIRVMTMQSCKGLESNNIVLYDFLGFLKTADEKSADIFYRKIYVLLTRSQENLYISYVDKKYINSDRVDNILKILKKYETVKPTIKQEKDNIILAKKLSTAKLFPIFKTAEEQPDESISVSKIFKFISSLFIK